MSLPPAIFLMGATATGKTELALQLADSLPVELISVDSALVYKGMNIGTAKPDKATLNAYPHYLIDIKDPSEPYSAAEFTHDALNAMHAITQRGHIPLLVGGTMLYHKMLTQGIATLPSANPQIRAELNAQAQKTSWQEMHKKLQKVDPASAQKIKPNDSQRIQRALEVHILTGQPLSQLQQTTTQIMPYTPIYLGLVLQDRQQLHQRIAQRLENMFAAGFIQEVEQLYQRSDLHSELPAIRSVGYRQIWDYLAGNIHADEMRQKALFASRQLAKRQLTWLRKWQDLNYLEANTKDIFAKSLKILNSTAKINNLS